MGLYKMGSGLDEAMGPARSWILDGAGHGEDLAALIHGEFGGDERAAVVARLHHQGPQGQRADETIAPREMGRMGRRAHRECPCRTHCGYADDVYSQADSNLR